MSNRSGAGEFYEKFYREPIVIFMSNIYVEGCWIPAICEVGAGIFKIISEAARGCSLC